MCGAACFFFFESHCQGRVNCDNVQDPVADVGYRESAFFAWQA